MQLSSKLKHNLFLLLLVFLLIPGRVAAGEVDVKEIVFEHLGDSYEWHMTQWGEKEFVIHLPVIVKGKEKGWHIFSSARLAHGAEYEGFHIASEGEYKGKVVEINPAGDKVRPSLDISLTKNALALWINCIVLLCLILPLVNWYKKSTHTPPSGWKGAVEILMINIRDEVIKPCIGEDYKRFTPYLLTVFFFIFINNIMGLIPFFPGGANVTGNIAITLVLALCTFLAVNLTGTKEYWKEIFWPEVPVWLKLPAPIMPVIEIFGVFTKPFALMIRLFANIMAGHSVILGLICLIFITVSMGAAINTGMSILAVLFSVFMNFVEILVAYIQAYVFTLLSAVFIGLSKVKQETH
ncbi:ATP synthase F0 subunit A [Parabacteroides sp. 52]|uniref:F0F1 ATP synthase subunit A n=1 Tax=unclassified Parabacteroides TaxID=2649774 RepID=UPI0013D08D3D|nr:MULTISPECIES: F0F1 ATP synthase subunit A [unclassified Parabacteroides]MDH6535465.1 F-type H+-transporting ATPase subunit a [Parabacteroides sp. PM5-20]NDV55955.1 ATP synthase F0 subunit A [Parabacteroides sp. 52]